VNTVRTIFLSIAVAALGATAVIACGSGAGACVGTGGLLASPVCKEDWDEAECDDWDAQEINGASWSFNGGDSCTDLGYTEKCSDGSYRRSGAC
jgi:hypothetical protein